MTFTPVKNPSAPALSAMISASKYKAVRRIIDLATGDAWHWPAEQATHREGADALRISYDRKPGEGEILI